MSNLMVFGKRAAPVNLEDEVELRLKAFIFEIAGNKEVHAEMIVRGFVPFKPMFVAALRGAMSFFPDPILTRVDGEQLAHVAFQMMERIWMRLYHPETPVMFMLEYSPVAPPTEAELNNKWEVEIASEESYMRRYWEGSARTRKGNLEDLGQRRDPHHG